VLLRLFSKTCWRINNVYRHSLFYSSDARDVRPIHTVGYVDLHRLYTRLYGSSVNELVDASCDHSALGTQACRFVIARQLSRLHERDIFPSLTRLVFNTQANSATAPSMRNTRLIPRPADSLQSFRGRRRLRRVVKVVVAVINARPCAGELEC